MRDWSHQLGAHALIMEVNGGMLATEGAEYDAQGTCLNPARVARDRGGRLGYAGEADCRIGLAVVMK